MEEKVISLADRKKQKKESEEAKSETKTNKESESFEDVMKRNEENRKRLEKERANNNKSTLRSYRIKH